MVRGVAPFLVAAALALSPAVHAAPVDVEGLEAAIELVVRQSTLSRARVAVQVVGLEDGKVLYERNPDDLLNPASNVKLFTSAAALAILGPEYRFDTEFLVDKQVPDARRPQKPGEYRGNLYVRGTGDPSLNSERLWGIVNELWLNGLRSVSGDLVLDDTWFDGQRVGPGFDQEDSDRPYMAPTGALSLNWNAVGIYLRPGERIGAPALVELSAPSDFFVIDNQAVTVKARGRRRLVVSSVADGARQRLVIRGVVPLGQAPMAVWKKIDSPADYFGQSLKKLLVARGIKVRGKVRIAAVGKDAQPLYLHQSETLELVLKRVNKNSSNFAAEQLVKAMGAHHASPPGSWPKGIAAIEHFLSSEVGIPLGTFVMKNGSGLNDANRFSAAQITRLLRYMFNRFPLAPEYLSSLGIAGKDGTLRSRMEGTDAVGRLRAKTGTLENVSALSGYVQTVSGEKLVFAVMVNDFPGRTWPVVQSIDAVGSAIAAYGSPEGPSAGAALALGQPPLVGPLVDLPARIATYEELGRLPNRRNLTFLRTALKSERDPALRAVVADAIYRSDPDEPGGVRLLLENFDPGPEVFGRLREVGRGSTAPTPVLDSIVALAAEGNPDALTHLVQVAAAAKADDGLRAELLEPLAEVARNAPEELIGTLRAASGPTADATLALIANSLAAVEEEGEHPFPAAVKRSLASQDPQQATFAAHLAQGLSIELAIESTGSPATGEAVQVIPAAAIQGQGDSQPAMPPGG